LLGISLDLAMIAARTLLDHQILGMPGGSRAAVEPAILLIAAAIVVGWPTGRGGKVSKAVIQEGTFVGLMAGALEITHITVENFGRLSARTESVATGGFLIGLLLLWTLAGYRATRRCSQVGPGLLAGSWCAMVGMLLTVTYGFSQLFWGLPGLEHRNVLSPDFLRSGWTDLHLFTIADVFESGFKVLLIGPIAGAILGGLGALLARAVNAARGQPIS
jgi:hypothetical protein